MVEKARYVPFVRNKRLYMLSDTQKVTIDTVAHGVIMTLSLKALNKRKTCETDKEIQMEKVRMNFICI